MSACDIIVSYHSVVLPFCTADVFRNARLVFRNARLVFRNARLVCDFVYSLVNDFNYIHMYVCVYHIVDKTDCSLLCISSALDRKKLLAS